MYSPKVIYILGCWFVGFDKPDVVPEGAGSAVASYILLAKACFSWSFSLVSLRACRESGEVEDRQITHGSPCACCATQGSRRARVGAHLGAPSCRQEEGSTQQDGDVAELHGCQASREMAEQPLWQQLCWLVAASTHSAACILQRCCLTEHLPAPCTHSAHQCLQSQPAPCAHTHHSDLHP